MSLNVGYYRGRIYDSGMGATRGIRVSSPMPMLPRGRCTLPLARWTWYPGEEGKEPDGLGEWMGGENKGVPVGEGEYPPPDQLSLFCLFRIPSPNMLDLLPWWAVSAAMGMSSSFFARPDTSRPFAPTLTAQLAHTHTPPTTPTTRMRNWRREVVRCSMMRDKGSRSNLKKIPGVPRPCTIGVW